MNAVGIDVSKGKSMVAIARPFGEIVAKPFSVPHTSTGMQDLLSRLATLQGDTRIIMEHTGRYYKPMAECLSSAGFFVWSSKIASASGSSPFSLAIVARVRRFCLYGR